MAATDFDLLASYWTIAGDVCPFAPNEASPPDFRARVAAAASAGYRDIGLNHDDLVAVLARDGAEEAKSILADHGILHLELEFITDWFADGDRRRASDFVRRGLLDGAAQLGVNHVKVGGVDQLVHDRHGDAGRSGRQPSKWWLGSRHMAFCPRRYRFFRHQPHPFGANLLC